MKYSLLLFISFLSLLANTQIDSTLPNNKSIIFTEICTFPFDGYPEWIELYNTSDSLICISGWTIALSDSQSIEFMEDDLTLESEELLVVYLDGKNSYKMRKHIASSIHTNEHIVGNLLGDSSGVVTLLDSQKEEIDKLEWGQFEWSQYDSLKDLNICFLNEYPPLPCIINTCTPKREHDCKSHTLSIRESNTIALNQDQSRWTVRSYQHTSQGRLSRWNPPCDIVSLLDQSKEDEVDSIFLQIQNQFSVPGCPTCEKPIIYLYPTEPTDITVLLDSTIDLIFTYPKYKADGWKVTAEPNGDLTDQESGKQYYSLFWEGYLSSSTEITEGFVIQSDSIITFLEEKLEILGLNFRESQEFILYWAPVLERNRHSLIHFSTDEYMKSVPLTITPKPETEIRFMMEFKSVDEIFTIPEQQLTSVTREGYTVVEWGGTNLDRNILKMQ